MTDAELTELERLDRDAPPGLPSVYIEARNALPKLLAIARAARAYLDAESKLTWDGHKIYSKRDEARDNLRRALGEKE